MQITAKRGLQRGECKEGTAKRGLQRGDCKEGTAKRGLQRGDCKEGYPTHVHVTAIPRTSLTNCLRCDIASAKEMHLLRLVASRERKKCGNLKVSKTGVMSSCLRCLAHVAHNADLEMRDRMGYCMARLLHRQMEVGCRDLEQMEVGCRDLVALVL